MNYTPGLGIAFDDTISGELLRLQFRGQQSSAREWGLPQRPVLCLQLLLGIIVGFLFGYFPPPFLLQFFISPHCILQFLTVESVIKLGVNVAYISSILSKQGLCCMDVLQSTQNFIVAVYYLQCDCSALLLQLKPLCNLLLFCSWHMTKYSWNKQDANLITNCWESYKNAAFCHWRNICFLIKVLGSWEGIS